MRRATFYLVLLLFLPFFAFTQDTFDRMRVKSLIVAIATNSPSIIEKVIQFPIRRRYPLPAIVDGSDFRSQYAELFDNALIESIQKSSLDTDWASVGLRGLMFNQGTLWVNSFSDYKIVAINYETELGREHWEKLVAEQRQSLPSELRTFDSPQLEFLTVKNRFRVDEIGRTYRLVRFTGKSTQHYDLLEEDGILDFDGNIGDYHIDWRVKDKTYRIAVSTYKEHLTRAFLIFDSRNLEDNPDTKSEYEEVEATKF